VKFSEKPKIILGDCLEVLKETEENSVDLIVTSPPVTAQPTPWEKNTFVSMAYETHAIFMP
jgi:predicted methyltransferase